MSAPTSTKHLVLATTMALFGSACSTAPESSSKPGAGATADPSSANATGTGGTPGQVGAPAPTPHPGIVPSTVAANVFDAWCAAAAQTNVVKTQLVNEYNQLCQGGRATALFSQTLIASAYAGGGAPALTALTPTSSQGNTTRAFVATAVKIPITMAQHFQVAAPLSGNQANQTKVTQAQGVTVSRMDITPDQVNDAGWARGWTVHAGAAANAGFVQIQIEYVQEHDQYVLAQGSAYMYAEFTKQGLQTIQKRNQLTAGVQVGDAAYLICVSSVQVNNQGFGDVAVTQINNILGALTKAEYDNAVGQ